MTSKTYAMDDEGNVARFVDTFEDDLMYVVQYKKWFYWTGAVWKESLGHEIDFARSMIRSMHTEAQTLLTMGDMEGYKRLTQHITKSAGRIPYLVGLAAKSDAMRTSTDDLDQQRSWVNCRNYVIDVATGTEMAPDPKDRLTRATGTLYVPGSTAPKWESFLEDVIPDPELRSYVQRLAGYSLLGNMNERLIVFLHGVGRNGKSVFVETLRSVLGDYAVGTPIHTFLKKPNQSGPSNDLARLRGARLVAASEFEEGAKANTSLLKQVTGDEKITARPMYGEYFDFPFEATIWVSTNHMPFVGAQQAIWDRIKLIPFTTRIDDTKVDVRIKEKLQAEAPGILQWCLEGARSYLEQGLHEPPAILVESMNARNDQDLLAPFLEECCDADPTYAIPSSDLYKAYAWWAVQRGEKPVSQTAFGRRMGDSGYRPQRTAAARQWLGLRLKAVVHA